MIFICNSEFLFGQVSFERLYAPFSGQDHSGRSIVTAFDSGYMITGSLNEGAYNSSVLIMKISSEGEIIWSKQIGSGLDCVYGYSIRRTLDSCYVVCAKYSILYKILVVKINQNGDTLWTKTYTPGSYSVAKSIATTSDSCFILTGYTSVNQGTHWLLMKIDKAGNLLWSKQFGNPERTNIGSEVHQTKDNCYIIAGYRSISNGDSSVATLSKTDSIGNLLWTKYYSLPLSSSGKSLQETRDSGYILCGNSNGGSLIIKTNKDGDTLWTRVYMIEPDHWTSDAFDVIQSSDGNYLVTGYRVNSPPYSINGYLLQLDEEGNMNWIQHYSTTGQRDFNELRETNDSGFVMVGTSIAGSFDSIYVVKTDRNGLITGESHDIEEQEKHIQIYPTINNGNFSIESSSQIERIEIFDIFSKLYATT